MSSNKQNGTQGGGSRDPFRPYEITSRGTNEQVITISFSVLGFCMNTEQRLREIAMTLVISPAVLVGTTATKVCMFPSLTLSREKAC